MLVNWATGGHCRGFYPGAPSLSSHWNTFEDRVPVDEIWQKPNIQMSCIVLGSLGLVQLVGPWNMLYQFLKV